MTRSPVVSFAIGTGVAAGTSAAVRAWTKWGRWGPALGATAGAVVGGACYFIKGLRPCSKDIVAGAVLSQAPLLAEQAIASVRTGAASTGLVAAERLGLVRAEAMSGALPTARANMGSHFGAIPVAGAR